MYPPVFWIRIHADSHSFWSAGSGSALGIRIRIEDGQTKWPEKWRQFMFWNARCSLLRDEDSPLAVGCPLWSRDPDPHWQKMLDPDAYPDPQWNLCGSTTLVSTQVYTIVFSVCSKLSDFLISDFDWGDKKTTVLCQRYKLNSYKSLNSHLYNYWKIR